MKHIFYSLLITFVLAVLLELARPNFVTNFINMNWLFLILIVAGIVNLRRNTD